MQLQLVWICPYEFLDDLASTVPMKVGTRLFVLILHTVSKMHHPSPTIAPATVAPPPDLPSPISAKRHICKNRSYGEFFLNPNNMAFFNSCYIGRFSLPMSTGDLQNFAQFWFGYVDK